MNKVIGILREKYGKQLKEVWNIFKCNLEYQREEDRIFWEKNKRVLNTLHRIHSEKTKVQ